MITIKKRRNFAAFLDESGYRIDIATIKNYYSDIKTDYWCTDCKTRTAYYIVINEKKKLTYFDIKKWQYDLKKLDEYLLNPLKEEKVK